MVTFSLAEVDLLSSDPVAQAFDDFRARCELVVADLKADHGWSDADQRVFSVHHLRNVMQSVLAVYAFNILGFRSEGFWSAFFVAIPSMADFENHNREFNMLVKFAALHGLFSVLEADFRGLVKVIDPKACDDGRASFAGIANWLLTRATSAKSFEPLVRLVRLTRNTIHNNGVHRPANRQSETVVWAGKNYEFLVDTPIEFANWQFVSTIADGLLDLVRTVVTDEFVASMEKTDVPN